MRTLVCSVALLVLVVLGVSADVAPAGKDKDKPPASKEAPKDAPSKEKIVALREFLDSLNLKLPSASNLRAGDFKRLRKEFVRPSGAGLGCGDERQQRHQKQEPDAFKACGENG